MTLVTELKRRKVFKVAAAYLVVGWLLIQVAATVAPQLNLPEWAPRLITFTILLGFPIVLVMAWIFDVTPEGIKVDASRAGSKRMFVVAAVMTALSLGWYFHRQAQPTAVAAAPRAAATPTASERSIAVMPFLNMSSDKDQDYFSDGMTEEILNALAKVPKLEVTARTSVFSLKGQNHDVRELGKMLGVAYLLEGSVRKAGNEVRITAQLIRTDNGFHLWSETYDRKLENVFALQAELAGAIAQALQLPLGMGGSDGLVSERSTDPQAYALYLQARAGFRARGDGVKKSIELYREAIKHAPKFAPAWAGLASSLAVLPWYVPETEKAAAAASMQEAEAAGKQALALSPDLPQAHTALAAIYSFQWQWALAEQHFKRALALAPNDPELLHQYADWLGAVGRSEEALAAASKAVELDPLAPIFLNGKANTLVAQRRIDEAIEIRQAAFALAPDLQMTTNNLFGTYVLAGRLDEAEKLLDQTRASDLARAQRDPAWDPRKGVQRLQRATIRLKRDPTQAEAIRKELGEQDFARLQLAISDDIDMQFKRIEAALAKHVNGVDPVVQLRSFRFAAYRKDPRYIRLLNKAGFDDQGNIR